MSLEILARAEACQDTLNYHIDLPASWGKNDCARMCARHLKNMGHKISLSKFGSYSSYRGALSALKKAGVTTIEELIDSLGFERIPPAASVMGDIIAMKPEEGIDISALAVRLDGDNYLHTYGGGFVVSVKQEALVAWRVSCFRVAKPSDLSGE